MKSGKRRKADRDAPKRVARTSPRGGAWRQHRSGIPVSAKLLGAACFAAPLVLAIPYGTQLFASSALLRNLLLKPLLPLVVAFHSSRYANLLSIVAIYGLIAKNKSMHPFTRAIGRQASTLMMMQFPANFLLQFSAAAPGPIANLMRAIIFLYFLYCVALGSLGSMQGRARDLPLVGSGLGSSSLRGPRPQTFRPGG